MKNIKSSITGLFNWFKSRSLIQKLLILGLIAGLVFLLTQANKGDDQPTYEYATVESGSITQMVSETGEIMSSNQTEIMTSINGIVKELYVNNNSQVTRGQSLFYVTSTATEQERSKAYSDYLSAQNSLSAAENKKLTLESDMWQAHEKFEADSLDTDLSVDDPIFIQTERDWKASEADYLNQDQVITQAKAAVSSAWLSYQAMLDGSVKATADGTVANLSVASGQSVSASDTAMIIISPTENWAKVAINENDIVDVQPQQRAEVSVDALDQTIPATVERVDSFGTLLSDVVVYYVYLTLDQTPASLMAGMTTQIDIITQEKNDILMIPNTAIKPYQSEKAVQIIDPATNTSIYQPITTGVSGDVSTEVVSGLQQGQQVIISETSSSDGQQSGGLFQPPH